MENLLNKDSVKRVQEFIKKFDPKLKILVLDTTARTAIDAANSLLNYGFNVLGIHRIWSEIYSFDKKKKEFFKKLNFKLDGKHRETYWYYNKWHDSLFYSILSKEFKK